MTRRTDPNILADELRQIINENVGSIKIGIDTNLLMAVINQCHNHMNVLDDNYFQYGIIKYYRDKYGQEEYLNIRREVYK